MRERGCGRFMARLTAAAALLLVGGPLAFPAAAQSTKEAAQLEAAVARGRLLYELDIAGWVSTDRMLADDPEARNWPLRGWLVEPDPTAAHAWIVTYYVLPDGEAGAALPAYRSRVENGKATSGEVIPLAARQPLSAPQMRIVRAVEAARSLKFASCTAQRLNVTVIPPASAAAPLEIYLLTPQTEEKVFPIGGHYKAVFDADGRLLSKRAFSKACLNMDVSQMPAGAAPASLFVTHLLDKVPTEMHVLSAIQIGVPLVVGTGPKRLWTVTPESIRRVN